MDSTTKNLLTPFLHEGKEIVQEFFSFWVIVDFVQLEKNQSINIANWTEKIR